MSLARFEKLSWGRHAATNGTHKAFRIRKAAILTDSELSKEDEAAVGKDELEVRREDQDKINKFSRLHQRETTLEDELKTKAVCDASFLSSASALLIKAVEGKGGSRGTVKRVGARR